MAHQETEDAEIRTHNDEPTETSAADSAAVEETDSPEGGQKNALQALREITSEDDDRVDSHSKVTLSSILGGDMLGGQWFRRQFWFIMMIVGMLIIYVSNRYSCQQEMIETKVLNDTLLDRRYKALTRSSQLKERMRRSYIEETLVDTTLQTANTPSFYLKVDE